MLFLCANGYATFQRNKVWKTVETLWHDVVIKSPGNGRGLMNYGNSLMARRDYRRRSRLFSSRRSRPSIQCCYQSAIAEDATKQSAAAEQHFKDALRLAPTNPESYTYYARYLLSHSRAQEARAFLRSALEFSPSDLTARELLAKADGQAVNQPETQTPEYYLELSLQHYREGRYAESIAASHAALKLRSDYAEAWNNIGAAYNKLGRYGETRRRL